MSGNIYVKFILLERKRYESITLYILLGLEFNGLINIWKLWIMGQDKSDFRIFNFNFITYLSSNQSFKGDKRA